MGITDSRGGISLGAYRIVTGLPIHYFIIAGYVVVVIQTTFAPRMIVPWL